MAFEAAALRSFPTVMELSQSFGEIVAEAAAAAIEARGRFVCALSGGSVIEFLRTGLLHVAESGADIKTDKWHFFYVDERCVPLDSDDSNYNASQVLFRKPWSTTPPENVHAANPELSPEDMAADYQRKIQEFFGTSGTPSFDLVILGVGPDGHTASLFPGHPLLEERTKLVASLTDSPKPPPARITFTYPLIEAAHKVLVVAAGTSKRSAFAKVHHHRTVPDATLPLVRLRPANGKPAVWLADKEATMTMEDEIDRSGK